MPDVIRRRVLRSLLVFVAVLAAAVQTVAVTGFAWASVGLSILGTGTPAASARSTGADAEWLGHAWVDGRKTRSDVDALATQLRGTGIRDLFVHTGPFSDDGSLQSSLRPRARWLIGALHAALPGVRVQAWLGAHPVPGQLDLGSATTRRTVLTAMSQVLDDGFDGIHLDMEPVDDGDPDLVTLVHDTHAVTKARHAVLSLSVSMLAPVAGLAGAVAALPGRHAVWSAGYLHRLAEQVDQVAVMAYDTWSWTPQVYTGWVRRMTTLALRAVPTSVALLIGVPAYADWNNRHRSGIETTGNALRGVRLALGTDPPGRPFGVAIYVDFTVTAADWTVYHRDWYAPAGHG